MSASSSLAAARHVVVTGAAGAIGGALAVRLAACCPEARLALVDVAAEPLEARAARLGPRATAQLADLARPQDVPQLVERLVDEAGGVEIDVLVNCAGIMELRSLVGMPWALAQKILDVDLVSPLRLMSLVAPQMVARGRGVVVNISSMAGVTPLRGATFYGAAKAGLAIASEIAALELAPHGVHVVTVYPGPVASGLERHARGQLPPTLMTRALPTGDPERLADLIAVAMADPRKRRVVYPPLYDLASRVPALAGRLTRWLSPTPHE